MIKEDDALTSSDIPRRVLRAEHDTCNRPTRVPEDHLAGNPHGAFVVARKIVCNPKARDTDMSRGERAFLTNGMTYAPRSVCWIGSITSSDDQEGPEIFHVDARAR